MPVFLDISAQTPVPLWAMGVAVVIAAVAKILPILRRWWAEKRKLDREEDREARREAARLTATLEQRIEHEREERHKVEDQLAAANREIELLKTEGAKKDLQIATLEQRVAELEIAVKALRCVGG